MGIVARIADWLGLSTRSAIDDAVTRDRERRIWPDMGRAVTLPAVYRSISLLSTAVSQVPIVTRRGDKTVRSPNLVRRPDIAMPQSRFVRTAVAQLAGLGNCWWYTEHDPATDAVINVQILDPTGIAPIYDPTARAVTGWRALLDGTYRDIPARRIRHLRLLEMPGSVLGLGPIQACRVALSGAMDLRDFSAGWFRDGAVPTGVLTTDQQLTPADADMYRTRWQDTQAKRGVAVLGKGLTYEPIVLNPKDAQFVESQAFAITEVARMFGIPAVHLHAAVEGQSMTYTNITDLDTHFARYTLMQYMGVIQEALGELTPGAATPTFDLAAMLRPAPKAQAEVYALLINAGVMDPDEVRPAYGLEPRTTTEETNA